MKKLTLVIILFMFGFINNSIAQSLKHISTITGNENIFRYILGTNVAPPQQPPQNSNQDKHILKPNPEELTYTYIRCFYYDDYNNLQMLWGKTSDNQYAIAIGSWTKGDDLLYNQFYTKATPAEIENSCKLAATESDILFSTKFINYGAGNYQISFYSEFWFDDISPKPSDKKPITKIVVFGDSLSDTYNMYNKTDGIIPKNSAYTNGRFTNGLVWDEYIAKYLKSTLQVYAEAGAQIIDQSLFDGYMSLTLNEQIDKYQSTFNFLPASARNLDSTLFIVFIGGNDFVNFTASPEILADHYLKEVEYLVTLGAKYIVVPIYFDLSIAPKVTPENKPYIRANIKRFNMIVQSKIRAWQKLYANQGVKFLTPNFYEYLNNIKKSFSNITGYCNQSGYLKSLTGTICEKRERSNYLFWDNTHPSARAHCYLAYYTNLYLAQQLKLPKPSYPFCDLNSIDKIN